MHTITNVRLTVNIDDKTIPLATHQLSARSVLPFTRNVGSLGSQNGAQSVYLQPLMERLISKKGPRIPKLQTKYVNNRICVGRNQVLPSSSNYFAIVLYQTVHLCV